MQKSSSADPAMPKPALSQAANLANAARYLAGEARNAGYVRQSGRLLAISRDFTSTCLSSREHLFSDLEKAASNRKWRSIMQGCQCLIDYLVLDDEDRAHFREVLAYFQAFEEKVDA